MAEKTVDMPQVLHIITVHWRTNAWIELQLRYCKKHITMPFKVWASVDEMSQVTPKVFHFQTELEGSHDEKLDHLAQIVAADPETNPDDWLIFLDGDAFPVGDLVAFGKRELTKAPLLAVQRLENNHDIQPHPSFCLTTVGFWQEIGGTWKRGYEWKNAQGKMITDVGGELLEILRKRDVEWHPMVRSNGTDRHPVFFGIYDEVVYHHGAGFRVGCSRKAIVDIKEEMRGGIFSRVLGVVHRCFSAIRLPQVMKNYVTLHYWARKKALSQSERQGREVFEMAKADMDFFKRL